MIELAFAIGLFIYDGDNIRVQGTTYRLATHNAPEISGKCIAERWLALRARDRLRALAEHYTARLYPVPCVGTNFGRACARVEVQGTDVSKILISEGLAEAYSCASGKCPPRTNWCAQIIRLPND